MTKVTYEQWVKALRGGNYKQGNGALKKELADGSVGYCCLGVLADLMGLEPRVMPDGHVDYAKSGDIDIYMEIDTLVGPDHQDVLLHINDFERRDFTEIANYIEEELMKDD